MSTFTDDRLSSVQEIAATHAAEVDRDGRFPQEAVDALATSGLLGLTLPEELGGLGGGPVEFLEVVRGIANADASSAMIYLMHVCAAQVVLAGTASGDSPTLRGLADGSRLGTLAFSERGSRSHFWAPVSQEIDGRISAQKSWVTSAGHADDYVVATRAADRSRPSDRASTSWARTSPASRRPVRGLASGCAATRAPP